MHHAGARWHSAGLALGSRTLNSNLEGNDLVQQKVPIAAIARQFGIARSTVRARHEDVAAEKACAQGGESLVSAAG
jgi:Helix-turn-helix domain of resolvase